MEIAVLGGSNGAYAAATDLTEKGHQVRLWRRDTEAFGPVLSNRVIKIKDVRGVREISISCVSGDLETVVTGAQLIVIPLPAFAQESVAKQLAPYLQNDQVIFLPPGSFGSYIMYKTIRNHGCEANISIAETGTLPYLARKHDIDTVSISGRATRLPTGVLPADNSLHALAILQAAYPSIEPIQDALDGALMNAGPIIHPPLILMNAGPIQHFERWDIHNEGTQPWIRSVHDALDAERIALREALGYFAPHYPLADHYNTSEGEEWMYGLAAHEKLVDSADWHEPLDLITHRYMREDIACGLAFLVSLAEWAGIKVPVASGLLAIASSIVREDLRLTGRTIENCGLANFSITDLKQLLKSGELRKKV
ncbi:NAD/NADP-dependent octopine/nopaline dehydrogenase family protein [Brevibacillus daliensis]|uniref:NAD/NADP-dependent octopine/nopaline dehydrogenase family protein n=1 Tax=Brevibacillus daliensis TaxID=2892995 RepID=UPI001E494B45|nr:NAD/NADP-dependent octopine/nopaline dehydrogenase family protein [Brevibacillus daliensis]